MRIRQITASLWLSGILVMFAPGFAEAGGYGPSLRYNGGWYGVHPDYYRVYRHWDYYHRHRRHGYPHCYPGYYDPRYYGPGYDYRYGGYGHGYSGYGGLRLIIPF